MILRNRKEIYDGIDLDLVLVPKWDTINMIEAIRLLNPPTAVTPTKVAEQNKFILYKHKTENRICLIAPQDNMSNKNNLSLTLLVAGVVESHLHYLDESDVALKIGEIIHDAYMTVTERIIMDAKPEK